MADVNNGKLITFKLAAFFNKSLSGISSLNSSINSDSGLLATSTPLQTPTKHKNKENALNKFRDVVHAISEGSKTKLPSIVFGKIKSLWSAHSTPTDVGLNLLADNSKYIKKELTKVTSGREDFF